MISTLISSAIKVAIACLIVGLILSAFGVDPWQIYAWVGATVDDAFAGFAGFFSWAWRYIVIGAVIVVPLWLLLFLLRGGWRR